MSTAHATSARRTRVERNIYRRPTGILEIDYRDSTGKQRWKGHRRWAHRGAGGARQSGTRSIAGSQLTSPRECAARLAGWPGPSRHRNGLPAYFERLLDFLNVLMRLCGFAVVTHVASIRVSGACVTAPIRAAYMGTGARQPRTSAKIHFDPSTRQRQEQVSPKPRAGKRKQPATPLYGLPPDKEGSQVRVLDLP